MLTYPVNNPFRSPLISAFYIRAFGALPPDFTDDLTNPSTLLSYWDGTNASPTTKKDVINGWDMVAVEGPCLTLAVGDTVLLPMDDSLASTLGTGTLAYDGLNFAVTIGGTFYKLLTTGGKEFPLSEGAGTTFRDTTGKYEGEITAASPATMWTDNTQDDYFSAMYKGYYESFPNNGIQYPYNPEVVVYFNLGFTITGEGSLVVGGGTYLAGVHVVENLLGDTPILADKIGEVSLDFTGDIVDGAYPDYSILMDQHKTITAAFYTSQYLVEEYFEGVGVPSGWVTSAIPPDCDYAVFPLAGAQSMQCEYTKTAEIAIPDITTAFASFMINMRNPTPDGDTIICTLGTELYVRVRSTNVIRIYHGATAAVSTLTLSKDQTYYFWVEYLAGTGTDGEARVYVGTSNIFADATLFVETLLGTSTLPVSSVRFGYTNNNGGGDILFDNIKISSTPIGDV